MYDSYIAYKKLKSLNKGNFVDFHHKEIAEHYLRTLTQVLKEFNANLTEIRYSAFAWISLKRTKAWQHYINTNQSLPYYNSDDLLIGSISELNLISIVGSINNNYTNECL